VEEDTVVLASSTDFAVIDVEQQFGKSKLCQGWPLLSGTTMNILSSWFLEKITCWIPAAEKGNSYW
jgi:hypothetical protein